MEKIRPYPSISSKFVCIVDQKQQELAAIISSYISEKDTYPLVFEFPSVTSANFERTSEEISEHDLSQARAEDYTTFLNNILAKLPQIENLIIAGLTEDQKSYLPFLNKLNVIEITSIEDIDFSLGAFITNKGIIECTSEDILKGLNAALRSNSQLRINESAGDIDLINTRRGGVIIIEKEPFVASIIATNYAFSINADIFFVDRATHEDKMDLLDDFVKFSKGNEGIGKKIKLSINERLKNIEIDKYDFATFFTTGIPYSFALGNVLPVTHVNIHVKPDLFITNNIINHGKTKFGGAVLFSQNIYPELENDVICQTLLNKNYLVREFSEKEGSVINLSMALQLYPYDIFHICSHNKPLEGDQVIEEFTDRDGNNHVVEYDRLLQFTKSLKTDHALVQQKEYFTKFDGLVWRSPQLKSKMYNHYVFTDMQNAIRRNTDKNRKFGSTVIVENSYGITCSDGLFLGMIKVVASHSAPFIFNNTCWSWYAAAESFIVGGAKSYVGTFWNVVNEDAIVFATNFYDCAFSMSIMDAVFESQKRLQGTSSENIYMIWGLHFTRLYSEKAGKSRPQILDELLRSDYYWNKSLKTASLESTRNIIEDYISWLHNEITVTFSRKEVEELLNNKKQTASTK